jgi:methylenetetrahydrofolate dehydrogenase (NADP+)/methenyltetrahydrofolate cyclohydrolase
MQPATTAAGGTAFVIDGKAFAERLRRRVAAESARLQAGHGLVPGLATVLVGDDAASHVYVAAKMRQTREANMNSFEHQLPASTSEAELLALIERLNRDQAVHGILVQLPLPRQIRTARVLDAIHPDKDVDGFNVVNTGHLTSAGPHAIEVEGDGPLIPCTPLGCMMMIKDRLGDLAGLNAVVVGRSNIVGKPMAALLLNESCTVTIAHSRTRDLPGECRRADILVAALGKPEMVRGDWIKPGATVVDVGINRVPAPEKGPGKTRIVGDVAFQEAVRVAGAITPVPGGVGPVTIACLLRNTLVAACHQRGLPPPAL